jgi:hypothetical protein
MSHALRELVLNRRHPNRHRRGSTMTLNSVTSGIAADQ